MTPSPADSFPVHRLPPYHLGSIAQSVIAARRAGRDVVDLSQINPSIGVPPAALDRLVQATLRPHNHRYSASQGIHRLRQAIVQRYAQRYGVELDSEQHVVVTMGIKEGLGHLLLAVLNPSDSVVVPTPSYPVHPASIHLAGGGCIGVPLFTENDPGEAVSFELTADAAFFERLEATVDNTWPAPKLMVLSFPHNPTTSVADASFFERLVAFARSRSLFLIHDFAYADLGYDGYQPPSLLAAPGALDVGVELCSLSKGYSLPGWRLGWCVGNPELVAALKKIKSYLDFGIFQPLQIAAIEVLEQHDASSAEVQQTFQSRRDALVDGLSALGWEVCRPRSTVFAWGKPPVGLREGGSLAVANQLLAASDVAVCPGVGFDRATDNYVRFSLGENETRIRQAMRKMNHDGPQQEVASA